MKSNWKVKFTDSLIKNIKELAGLKYLKCHKISNKGSSKK